MAPRWPGFTGTREVTAALVVLGLTLGAASAAQGCGWWGDGEDDGPEAIVVEPGGSDASQRTPAEMARLSRTYRLGLGVTRDYAQARRWARLAALGGDPGGMNDLATMLESGLGGPVDATEARRLFRKAAEAGYPPAQHSLAMMLRDGRGGPADAKEASLWLGRAAEAGHVSAEIELAEEMWSRSDASASRKGCFWWLVALESGADGSRQRCRDEAPALDDKELAEIVREARQWARQRRESRTGKEGNRS